MKKEILADFLGVSRATAFNHWNESPRRKIIEFIDQYLTEDDLIEYLKMGKIEKLERLEVLEEITLFFEELATLNIFMLNELAKMFHNFAENDGRFHLDAFSRVALIQHFALFFSNRPDQFTTALRIIDSHEHIFMILQRESLSQFFKLFNDVNLRKNEWFRLFLSKFFKIKSADLEEFYKNLAKRKK